MATAFAHAGDAHAGRKDAAEWIRDPQCYSEAMLGVVEALMIGLPNATGDDLALLVERLKARLLTGFLNMPKKAGEPK
jgi:hypothetical protein